jgi:hypothetical protein
MGREIVNCRVPRRPRQIFAERQPDLTRSRARQTDRLRHAPFGFTLTRDSRMMGTPSYRVSRRCRTPQLSVVSYAAVNGAAGSSSRPYLAAGLAVVLLVAGGLCLSYAGRRTQPAPVASAQLPRTRVASPVGGPTASDDQSAGREGVEEPDVGGPERQRRATLPGPVLNRRSLPGPVSTRRSLPGPVAMDKYPTPETPPRRKRGDKHRDNGLTNS